MSHDALCRCAQLSGLGGAAASGGAHRSAGGGAGGGAEQHGAGERPAEESPAAGASRSDRPAAGV